MTSTAESNTGIKAVWAIPNFRLLWTGQTISQIGDGLTNLALLIVINQLTGSTTALATMMIVIALPQLVFGLVAGVYVDRWNRKAIMIISDLARGLLVLGFIFVRRPEDVWIFFVLGFIQAAVGTFFNPAKSAMIPGIVPQNALLSANVLSQTTQTITGVVGSGLAGVLVGLTHGAWSAFSLDAITFFVSAIFISRITLPRVIRADVLNARNTAPVQSSELRQVISQLAEGLSYLFSNRLLVGVMTTFAVTMLGLGAVNVLIVPFLVNNLQVPTEALGLIEAAQVAGMVIGGALVAALASRLKNSTIIIGGTVMLGLFVAIFGRVENAWLALVTFFCIGLSIAPVQAAASALLQATIPDDKRGRASSTLNTMLTLATLVSMGSAGLLGDWIGMRQVFYLCGAVTVISGLLAAVLMHTPHKQGLQKEIISSPAPSPEDL
jgi:MFS transporter, DHA3 family, macrolide efflux protein